MKKVLGNKKAICLFTLPAVILFTCLVFIPLIWSFTYTFFSGQPGLNFEFNGLDNYIRVFTDKTLRTTIVNNLIYVVVVGGLQIILGFCIAMLINFGVKKHQNLVRSLLFIPVVLPGVAVAQMFLKNLRDHTSVRTSQQLFRRGGTGQSGESLDRRSADPR